MYLKDGTDAARANALADELRKRPDIASVELRTPEQGLDTLRAQEGLGEAIDALAATGATRIRCRGCCWSRPGGDDLTLAESLRALPEADLVQHDAVWRTRLDNWLRFGGRVAVVLAGLLGLGALLVVGNTVRLDIQSRREEIGVLQLLGATDGFIRRPFLYLGAWYGLARRARAGAADRGVDGAARAAGGPRGQLRQPLRVARRGSGAGRHRDRRRDAARLARRRHRHRPLPAPDAAHHAS